MKDQQLERALQPEAGASEVLEAPPLSPLMMVLNQSIASTDELRQQRISEVARRQHRQNAALTAPAGLSQAQRVQQSRSTREAQLNELRTHHARQYAMARRTFDRLQREVLRDARYLQSRDLMAEYSYWKCYFESAAAMDSHTFQRFTLWHSRITQQARATDKSATPPLRRPEWRTLGEMLRVCDVTALPPRKSPGSAVLEIPAGDKGYLSIGAGLAAIQQRQRRDEASVRRQASWTRLGRIFSRPPSIEARAPRTNPSSLDERADS